MKAYEIHTKRIKENEDLAQLIAALLSDGSVERGLLMKFVNKDPVLIKKFIDLSLKVFRFPKEKVKGNFSKIHEQQVKRAYFCSVRAVSYLHQFTSTFRTKPFRSPNKELISYPNSTIPKFIIMGEKPIKAAFLQMYASCDGCVELNLRYVTRDKRYDLRGYITFFCKHPIIHQQLFELLKSMGFNPIKKIYEKTSIIQLTKTNEIKKFRKEISFINNCKITNSNWRVYFYWKENENVLDLLIHILENGMPKNLTYCAKNAKNKGKIMKYLTNFLNIIEDGGELENIKYKANRNFLTVEERKWITNRKGLYLENNVPYKLLTKQFSNKFNKEILPQTIFYYKHK